MNTANEMTGPHRAAKTSMLIAAAAVTVLGLGVAGCSNSPSKSSTNPTSNANAGNGGGGDATDSTQLVQYSQCMRKNGVSSFPDPVNGKLSLQVTKGGALDPSSASFQAAQQACKQLEPAGLYSGGGQNTGQQDAALKFVSCMRKNGVTNMPDPQNGHFLMGGNIDPNSPTFQKAMQACRSQLPGGGAMLGGGQ